ncbi:hypothetical protein NPIL_550471 [Nephila pilipes]|uniref:Uncharacterized protein n=1 Tax=Nephila pilipes TaxID=299642 RepID=A0A8X6Q5Y9_NEPPI|nr:hypothetical protein NPIL_550471 [Nephila pilipes]
MNTLQKELTDFMMIHRNRNFTAQTQKNYRRIALKILHPKQHLTDCKKKLLETGVSVGRRVLDVPCVMLMLSISETFLTQSQEICEGSTELNKPISTVYKGCKKKAKITCLQIPNRSSLGNQDDRLKV